MALRSGYKGFKKLLGLKMIRPGTLAVDNAVLANTFFPRSEQAVLGAKNINGTKYVSQTSASVVWTANDDGSITAVSGTATDNNSDIGVGINDTFVAPFTAQVKILGGLTGEIYLFPYDHTDGARPYKDATKTTRLTSSDNQWGDTPLEFYMIEGHKYVIAGRVVINTTVNNDTMYPRLLLATDTDPTYAPFVMTNKELTDEVIRISNLDFSKTAYNQGTYTDLNDITTSGMYSVFTSVLNKPSDITFVANGILIVNANPIVSQVSQILVACNTGTIYTREKSDQGAWSDWRKFTSTVVS